MSTPTKTPGLPQGILTPSCDVTPTRETAREDEFDDFALSKNDCSELPRDVKLALDVARQLHLIS